MNDPREILVVEDDPNLRYLATKRLRAAGFETIEAGDGLEAIHKMLAHPSCRRMLTDFVMPTFGGDAWIRFLERFCEGWTIVVMSSQDIDSGPFVCMPKPIDYENVLHVFSREAP